MTTHESIPPTSPSNGPKIQPKLAAEQVLLRLLEVIRGSESIRDFTPEYLSKIMGVEFTIYRPGNYGFGEQLTADWWYGLEVNQYSGGQQFVLSFDAEKKKLYPDMTEICQVDFEYFSTNLEKFGFTRSKDYAEHGRYVGDSFIKSKMRIKIIVGGEKNQLALGDDGHGCVKMIIIR